MSARDDAHEALIKEAWQALMDAACRADRIAAAEKMRDLIGKRSRAQVRRMERKQGLRA